MALQPWSLWLWAKRACCSGVACARVAAGVGVSLIAELGLRTIRDDIVVRPLGRDTPCRQIFATALDGVDHRGKTHLGLREHAVAIGRGEQRHDPPGPFERDVGGFPKSPGPPPMPPKPLPGATSDAKFPSVRQSPLVVAVRK